MSAQQVTILLRRGYKRYKRKKVKRRQQGTVRFPVGYSEETSAKERNRRWWTAWAPVEVAGGQGGWESRGWGVDSTRPYRGSTDGGSAYGGCRTLPSKLPTECVLSEGTRRGSCFHLPSPTLSPGLVHQPWPPGISFPLWEVEITSDQEESVLSSTSVSPWEKSAWERISPGEAPLLAKKTGGKICFLKTWAFNAIHFNKPRSSGILGRNICSTVGHAEPVQLTEPLPRILHQLKADKLT